MADESLTTQVHDPDEVLRTWLIERDVPCPVCAYNLRSVQSATCPECGAGLDLRVGSVDLKIGLWVTNVIAVAAALGFIGFYVVMFIPSVLYAGVRSEVLWFMVIIGGLCTLYVAMLLRLVHRRKKLWSRPRRAQVISLLLHLLLASIPVTAPTVIYFVGVLLMYF